MDNLANRVQSLPQEIFDKIYLQVFTHSDPGERVLVTSSYKPPTLLAVDRATREAFAENYFSRNIFVLEISRPMYEMSATGKKWLRSLSTKHSAHIREVRTAVYYTHRAFTAAAEEELGIGYRKLLTTIGGLARETLGVADEEHAVRVNVAIVAHIDGEVIHCVRAETL